MKEIIENKVNYFILVYGSELMNSESSAFFKWVCSHYENACNYGMNVECPWLYVNLKDQKFYTQIPGIKMAAVLNNHAVTISEFFTILDEYNKNPENFYNSERVMEIYEKYKGKELFVFNRKEFDCDDGFKKLKALRKNKQKLLDKERKRTFKFIHLSGIEAIESKGNYILPKKNLRFYSEIIFYKAGNQNLFKQIKKRQLLVLPNKGVYKAEVHQQGCPGEEYFDCYVEFSKDNLTLIDVTAANGTDLLRDLRIWKN